MMVSREDHRRPIGICGDRTRVAVENDVLETEREMIRLGTW